MRKHFSEEELYAAAEEAQEYLLSLLPSEDSCPPHEFSRAFTAKVEGIYKQLRACTLPHKRAALGLLCPAHRSGTVFVSCPDLCCHAGGSDGRISEIGGDCGNHFRGLYRVSL